MTTDMILLAGAGLLCVATILALSVIGVITSERRGVARSVAAVQALDSAPSVLKEEIERPFAERVIAPLGERMVGLGRRLVRADTARKIQYRLNIAGNPPAWDVNRILGLKVLGLALCAALGFLYLLGTGWPFYRVVVATLLAAAFGYVLPNILLYNAGQKRANLMRNALPDAMDLLTISVEAGLGFDAAVSRVAKNGNGPLNQEFARLLQEMQIGMGRVDAMRAMAERTSLPDLKSFCLAMVQADSLGIPIARVLRIQSQEMRTKRRQRAEEKAQQVPVRIMIPLVLFILPCLFIVILGPAGIQIAETFSGM
jgi:tight adherence protein C